MDCRSLEVIKTEPGRADAEVYITFKFTFVNRGTKNTDLKTRTEKSRFLKVAGQWLYMESDKFTETKLNRHRFIKGCLERKEQEGRRG